MGRSTDKETGLSEQRKYRTWTAKQKVAIVLAGVRGDRTVKEVCRESEVYAEIRIGHCCWGWPASALLPSNPSVLYVASRRLCIARRTGTRVSA